MMKKVALVAAAIVIAVAAYSLGEKLASTSGPDSRQRTNAPVAEQVRAALDEPDSIRRAQALVEALGRIDRANLESIVSAYEERFDLAPPSATSIELLAESWSLIDPEGAIDRVGGWPAELRQTAISALSRAWARRAPEQAMTWAESLSPAERISAVDAVFQGWAESGDEEVWTALATLIPGLDRESSTNIVMKAYIQAHGFDALLERVDALEANGEPGGPDDFKLSAIRTAIGLCAYYDPDKALTAARRYKGGPYDNGLLRRIAIYWVLKDPGTAMDAFLAEQAGPQRDKALRDGYIKWLRTAGRQALAWIPAGAANDPRYAPLVDLYAIALARKKSDDPLVPIRESAAFIDSIEDTGVRRETAILLAVFWQHHDPVSARAWIDRHGIAEAVELERVRRVAAKRAGEAALPRPPHLTRPALTGR